MLHGGGGGVGGGGDVGDGSWYLEKQTQPEFD
jgi:hypothetical protein